MKTNTKSGSGIVCTIFSDIALMHSLLQILWRKTTSGKLKALKVKGCDVYCPLEKFKDIVKNELPTKDNECGFE